MSGVRAKRGLAVMVLCSVALTGCTSDEPVEGEPSAAVTTAATAPAEEAGELRLRLEREFGVFGHHTLAAARAKKSDLRAATTAVDDAIQPLQSTLEDVYEGDDARRIVTELRRWADRVAAYARDDEGPTARRQLLDTAEEVAAVLATATDGVLERAGTSSLLREPLRATVTSIDAYADRDFDRAWLQHRSAYGDMIGVGQALSAGITEQFPDRFPGARRSGQVELNSALQQLLVEHALLSTEVMRRGSSGARDFDAAAAALNGNTEDLATALDTIYGTSSSRFIGAWRDRLSTMADYTVAVAKQRKRPAQQARQDLRRLDGVIGRHLATATEDSVAADEATDALREVTARLLDHVDEYVARDHDEAAQSAAESVTAAADFAALVANGIVEHRPEEFGSS